MTTNIISLCVVATSLVIVLIQTAVSAARDFRLAMVGGIVAAIVVSIALGIDVHNVVTHA